MKVRSILLLSCLVFFSCATTEKNVTDLEKQNIAETEENLIIEDQSETDTAVEEIEPEVEIIQITPEEEFITSLEGISISVNESPKQIVKRNKFAGNFSVKVCDATGVAVSDFSLNVIYPAKKEKSKVAYEEKILATDENGICSVAITNTDFAANDFVTFLPATDFDADEVKEAVKNKQVQIPFKIKSDVLNKGAVLFVWDFSEKNRPVNNSYEILSEFRNRGMALVGNAPVNDTSYIGKSSATLYKANYEIIEDSYGYLVCGTIKFTKPVEPCDDGYLCSLVAEISAINMKNGDVIFESTFTNEATGANWNKATGKCKDELAKQIVDALVYGL